MNKRYVIKAIYASGGHVVTEPDGKTTSYATQQQAASVCEVMNAVNRRPDYSFIVVEQGV